MSTLGVSLTKESVGWGWSSTRGPFTTETWKGTTARVKAKALEFQAAGWDVQVRPGYGLDTLEATSAQVDGNSGLSGEVVETWTLKPNKVLKDILDTDCAAVRALGDADVQELRHYQQNPPKAGSSPAFTTPAKTLALWALIKAGMSHFPVHQPVLRHSYAVPQNKTISLNWNNTERIITTATLANSEGLPANFPVPISSVGSRYGNPARGDAIVLAYGWYKNWPDLELQIGGRRSVSIEYEWGLWPTLIYGVAV